ncbi:MAG: hypothetical protein AAF737_01300 [Pseudomonadota bacterium]
MPYRELNSDKILSTIGKLETRIEERFPGSSLAKVCCELGEAGKGITADAEQLREPIWWVWSLVAAMVAAAGFVFFWVGTVVDFEQLATTPLRNVQGIEAALNTLIIAGVGLITVLSLENRLKRRRAIRALSPLRSITHVIDMHQLTKDPSAVSSGTEPTAASPKRNLTPGELMRYLDYCSEMLALTGKLAALYAQSVDDIEVVKAVNDTEMLTTNLSRKIWQKIMMIHPSTSVPRP